METQPVISDATETTVKSKWDNINDESKKKIVNSKISCQGEQLTLSELIGNNLDLLKELDVDALLKNEIIEVGEPIITCHGYDERYFVHRTFLKRDKNRIKPIEEVFSTGNFDCEQLSVYKEIVIADRSASGKSTAVANLALQCKDKNPTDLILTVDLNKCWKALLGMSFDSCQHKAISFFIDKLVQPKHPKIFKKLFEIKRVIIFFDGSDDLCPGPVDVLNELVTLLTKKHVNQVWYTTTNTLMKTNETNKKLVVCMKSFQQSDQVDFIVKYWYANGANRPDMRDIAIEIILKQKNEIEREVRKKIGAMFMSIMLAEIFHHANANDLPANFDVCWIFEKFLEQKFSILRDIELAKQHKKAIQYLAMKSAFRDTMGTLGYEDEFGYVKMPNDLCKLNIVYPNGYGKMKFLHKMLVFYIVGEWFYERYYTEFASSKFEKIYAYDNDDNDYFLNDLFDMKEFISLIADQRMSLITDKDKDITKLGRALVKKQSDDKKGKLPNTLGKILDHICECEFFGLFNVILKSWSQPLNVKFINNHFDEVLYDEDALNFILRFERRNRYSKKLPKNVRFVFPMLEWAAKHLTQENKQKLFSVKNDIDQCPFFWVVRGVEANNVYDTIKSLGQFYMEAFVDDRDKFYSLLFCSSTSSGRKKSSIVLKGDLMPDTSNNNLSNDNNKKYRESIFFHTPFGVKAFKALFEIFEDAFGKPKLIELLRFTCEGKVFTGSYISREANKRYQEIVNLLSSMLGYEETMKQFIVLKDKGRESFCALVKHADLDFFEKGWMMMEQTFEVEQFREMLIIHFHTEIIHSRIHTSVFMAAIKNPNLVVFENFLQMIMKLNNDDRELIDQTFQHLNPDTNEFSHSRPLIKAAEIHFNMAEFWNILKCYVTDIKNITNNISVKKDSTFLHIYIKSHYLKDGFKDMFAKFWQTLREDLDSSIVDNLLKSNLIECFEYHTAFSWHEIFGKADLEKIETTQSNSCNIF